MLKSHFILILKKSSKIHYDHCYYYYWISTFLVVVFFLLDFLKYLVFCWVFCLFVCLSCLYSLLPSSSQLFSLKKFDKIKNNEKKRKDGWMGKKDNVNAWSSVLFRSCCPAGFNNFYRFLSPRLPALFLTVADHSKNSSDKTAGDQKLPIKSAHQPRRRWGGESQLPCRWKRRWISYFIGNIWGKKGCLAVQDRRSRQGGTDVTRSEVWFPYN